MPRKIKKVEYDLYGKKITAMAEVPEEELKPLAKNEKLKYVGKDISRIDGYDKVSGTATFAFDKEMPRMAYSKILRSPHPHAEIKTINTKKAEKLAGVLKILTHENTEQISWYDGTTYVFDKHLRHEGDDIAFIVAETEEIANRAAKMIEVQYKQLPYVVTAEEAMKDDAPKLYDDGNVREPYEFTRGDFNAGLKEADETLKETFTTQVEIHNPTEPHCSVVNWDGDDLTIWDSTQTVFGVRSGIAGALGIKENKVRIIKKYMGGGFGSKLEAGKYSVMAALASKELGRPVRVALDRKEMQLAVGNRPDSNQTIKIGAKKDGTITAMSHEAFGAIGAHPSGASCFWPLRQIYKCPNIFVNNKSVYINAGRARAFRAPGHVQGTFALEGIIDDMAEKLGMDPIDFRMKNYAEKDQDSGLPYSSKRLKEAYKQGAEKIGWNRRNKKAGSTEGPVKKGIGVATQIWWGAGTPPTRATLKLNTDGSARVLCGTQDIGGGTYTILAQVAADVLEIPLKNVEVFLGDTANHPYGVTSGGSLTAPSATPAVYDAALQMKDKLISGAAAFLDIPEEQVSYKEGVFTDKNDSSNKADLPKIVDEIGENVMVTTGARGPNPDDYYINSFGAQFAEVEVDTMTGKVKVLRVVAAHDIGRVINSKTLTNQLEGGIMQGLGYALMEQRIMDKPTGKMVNVSWHDYKMATVMDTPQIDSIVVSDADYKISPVGAKGVGEPAMIPTPGAIGNAVYNAIGVRIKSLPITPDKVLDALYG